MSIKDLEKLAAAACDMCDELRRNNDKSLAALGQDAAFRRKYLALHDLLCTTRRDALCLAAIMAGARNQQPAPDVSLFCQLIAQREERQAEEQKFLIGREELRPGPAWNGDPTLN